MEVTATVTSKGQVTIPKPVREALGLVEGDQVLFRVEGQRATLARTPELLELAGSVSVPHAQAGFQLGRGTPGHPRVVGEPSSPW